MKLDKFDPEQYAKAIIKADLQQHRNIDYPPAPTKPIPVNIDPNPFAHVGVLNFDGSMAYVLTKIRW